MNVGTVNCTSKRNIAISSPRLGNKEKGGYGLISGFANRPKEEQEQLISNGYPQKMGGLLIVTAIGMIILLPLMFTSFKYVMEVQFGFMIVFLLGGIIYLSKYEVPKNET